MTSEMSVYVLKFVVCICDVSENTLSALYLRELLYTFFIQFGYNLLD